MAPPLTEGTHCLHATKIEKPLMCPPQHSLSLLFIYLLWFFFLSFFSPFVFFLPQQIRLMEGSQHNKDPERYMNIYYWDDFRARPAVSSQRNSEEITAIFTLTITFKLISISWRDVEELTSISFISRLKKLFNPSFSYLFDKIIQKQL